MKIEDLPKWQNTLPGYTESEIPNGIENFLAIHEPDESSAYGEGPFREDLTMALTYVENQQADKILQRLAVIFTDYKNAGFENSAQVTKFIMTEIEEIVKV